MYVILQADEAWSIMTLVVSQVMDGVELSSEARAAVRRWRSDRAEGTALMDDLAEGMNDALGTIVDERTAKLIRRKGRYVSTRHRR